MADEPERTLGGVPTGPPVGGGVNLADLRFGWVDEPHAHPHP